MAGAFVLVLWGIYKKEIQDHAKACFKSLYGALFQRHIARRVTETELKAILGNGLVGLETLLLLLLKEYQCDRVTVTEYEEKDGLHLATCVVEVRLAEMQSVQRALQQTPVDPSIWDEVLRIHGLPNRASYVPDARVLDNAVLRATLLDSGVWSAYYQSLPTSTGKPRATLALSWHRERILTATQLEQLRNRARGYGAVENNLYELGRDAFWIGGAILVGLLEILICLH
jgi:hypothetical protein